MTISAEPEAAPAKKTEKVPEPEKV